MTNTAPFIYDKRAKLRECSDSWNEEVERVLILAKSKEIKMGIIGTSKRGLTQIRNSKLVKELRITALCDKYANLTGKAYDLLGHSRVQCYTDYHKMLEEADMDAVFVVVEPENNADIVCDVLKAGKHVMCESLGLTIEDCWKVVLAVEKHGMKFQMAEQSRYAAFAESWKDMVSKDVLGRILFAQGQYFHTAGDNRFWVDSVTGEMITTEEARNNPNAVKSRMWKMGHWIIYLPHELGPLLRILDDRVTKVSCMATRRKSYIHEWLPISDMEVALMHTEKDTVMRMAASFTLPNYRTEHTGWHWYEMMGTRGRVETNRAGSDSMKMWLADSYMSDPAQVTWKYTEHDTPREALASGHGGKDFYPLYYFTRSILDDTPSVMDVYRSAETWAPAIIAGKSAEQGGRLLNVPDFRPNGRRKPGQA